MRKSMLFMLIAFLAIACSKDDPSGFDFDMDLLYGTWKITHIQNDDGSFLDVTAYIEPTYATFKKDGTYIGDGYFGYGSGTYTASGSTITTYLDGEAFYQYEIISLNSTTCQLIMKEISSGDDIGIKCEKQ